MFCHPYLTSQTQSHANSRHPGGLYLKRADFHILSFPLPYQIEIIGAWTQECVFFLIIVILKYQKFK